MHFPNIKLRGEFEPSGASIGAIDMCTSRPF